ncbi:hypothetical protein BT69DRAFT_5400 [Atractiella rhizophila]|nr:hypothetical protein BT69DRAFT_5400 [Atractiella rhizophila]
MGGFPSFLSAHHAHLLSLLALETRTHLPSVLSASVHTVNPYVQVREGLLIPILHAVQATTKAEVERLLSPSVQSQSQSLGTTLKRLIALLRERTVTSLAISLAISPSSSSSTGEAQPPLLRSGSSTTSVPGRRHHHSHTHHRQSIAGPLSPSAFPNPSTATTGGGKRMSFSLSRSRDNSASHTHSHSQAASSAAVPGATGSGAGAPSRSRRQASITGLGALMPPTPTAAASGLNEDRGEMQMQLASGEEEPTEWEIAFFSPFLPLLDSYLSIERAYFRSSLPGGENYRARTQLARPNPNAPTNVMERDGDGGRAKWAGVGVGVEKSGGVWMAADESWERVAEATKGWAGRKWMEEVVDRSVAEWLGGLVADVARRIGEDGDALAFGGPGAGATGGSSAEVEGLERRT